MENSRIVERGIFIRDNLIMEVMKVSGRTRLKWLISAEW